MTDEDETLWTIFHQQEHAGQALTVDLVYLGEKKTSKNYPKEAIQIPANLQTTALPLQSM